MRSNQQFTFSQVPRVNVPRSNFRRSHGLKTTFDSGYLIPVFMDEVLPGDTFNVRGSFFARLSTPIVPIMDNIYLDVFFFYVPNRLLWTNWQKLCGEQVNPGDSIDYSTPVVDLTAAAAVTGSIWDYFGLPVGKNMRNAQANETAPVAFWSRAYNLIYNEWFRDENLQNSVTVDKGDGPDNPANYVLKKRGKRHDYFTSCLPWPQKGTGVNLPLGVSAPVKTQATATVTGAQSPLKVARTTDGTSPNTDALAWGLYTAGGAHIGLATTPSLSAESMSLYPSNLYADLSNATAATINSLRQAFQIQRMQERDARGGTRYREILQSHFGVVSPDARLQRPEYLGGGTVPVNINPVAQTSATVAGQTPIGKLAGFGVAAASSLGFTKSFVEHGVILGLVSARADLTYQQGMPKMFQRRTRYDFYWPALAHLGEQAVLNKEIYYNADANDALVFGYQERWAEYRYKPSMITGKFRSNVTAGNTTVDIWHLSQNFVALPTLGDTFISEAPPISRVVAVNTEPQFLMDAFFDMQTARAMPTYSVPGLIDHF